MISRAWLVKLVFGAAILPAFVGLVFLLSSAGSATASNATAGLPAPMDLGEDGRLAGARGKPLVVMFSLPGCSFCNVVRRNYLVPLLRDLPESQRPVIREVQVNGSDTLLDFKHVRVSQSALARHYGVRFAPTVLLLDRAGNLLAAPIVGGDTAGLYGGYLDNAFAEAARKLAAARLAESSGGK